ncbi:CDC27 [Sanghuangporus weigelae]
MSDSDVNMYLEKEIIGGGKIVTYRLLSRRLAMHVNAAKNALLSFYTRKRVNNEPIYATFWLAGELHDQAMHGAGDEMEVDGEENRDALKRKVVIAGEEDLNRIKATFRQIHAFHVYSLSPTPLQSASQLCGSSREVHELDKVGGDGLAQTVGKIVSNQVKRDASIKTSGKPTTSRTAMPTKSRASALSISNPSPKESSKPTLKPSPSLRSTDGGNPKASGKLSWAKAKPKESEKISSATRLPTKVEEAKSEHPVTNGQRRGTKRKSDVRKKKEEAEEEKPEKEKSASAKATPNEAVFSARIKKGVILSDDEDENPAAKQKMPVKVKDLDESDAEQSVRAMMDIDDEFVTKASRSAPSIPRDDEGEEPPPTDHAESAMEDESDDPAPRAKPRKRQQKKNVPIGHNGLRKRRVVKSKTDFDEKGYMVTEDYSSYESVDEEEEEEKPKKQKSRAKTETSTTKRKDTTRKADETSASETDLIGQSEDRGAIKKVEPKKAAPKKHVLKPSASKDRQTNGSQKSLASFFGSGGGKTKK